MSNWRMNAALAVVGIAAASMVAVPATAQQQARVQLNLTPAGQVVAKKFLGAPAPETKALQAEGQGLMRQQQALVAAPKLDLVKFTALLRRQEALQTRMMRLGNDRMLRMLSELSEADRVAFLRGMSNVQMVPAPAKK